MNDVINISPTEPNLSTLTPADSGAIKLNNLPELNSGNSPKRSVNFGPGVEMLMNDKRRTTSPKSDIKLSDLESLDTTINLNSSSSTGTTRKDAADAIFNSMPINRINKSIDLNEKNETPRFVNSVQELNPTHSLGAASASDPTKEKHGTDIQNLTIYRLTQQNMYRKHLFCQTKKP